MFKKLKSLLSDHSTAKKTPYARYGRSFSAASFGRLTDFEESHSLTADIQAGLATVRARARALVRNDGYAQNIINSLKINIVGERGVSFSCQAKDPNGNLDKKGNDAVNKAWLTWGKYGNCTVEGNADWVKTQELVLETVATDGECLVRLHRGGEFGRFGFQVEVLQADQLDENYYSILDNGNIIFQGVELNKFFKPQAYWIWKYNRKDPAQRLLSENVRIRVPASDILHIYDVNHPKQVRGLSWLVGAIVPLHHHNKLIQSEIEVARLATIKPLVYRQTAGLEDLTADELDIGAEHIGRKVEPGMVEVIPPGFEPVPLDWGQDNSKNNGELGKRILRNAAASVNVSYNSLAKDLESINYSSARFGHLEDRAFYSSKQRWFIDSFVNQVYREWLTWQLLQGKLPFGMGKFDKFFSDVKWQARGWSSVDPAKESKAAATMLALYQTTISDELAKVGKDFNETLHERVSEELAIKQAYEAAGLPVPPYCVDFAKVQAMIEKAEASEPPESDDD